MTHLAAGHGEGSVCTIVRWPGSELNAVAIRARKWLLGRHVRVAVCTLAPIDRSVSLAARRMADEAHTPSPEGEDD